ncbi:MAG: glycosyltransferase family 4 protein, partial [Microthrixaceae bacterium]
QDWHRVPGGTAVAANALAAALVDTGEVGLTGVSPAGPAPGAPWNPPVATEVLRLRLPWLYESWDRLRWPRVTSAVSDADLVHLTVPIAPPPERVPMVATVHDVLPLTMPEMFTKRGARMMRRGLHRIRDEASMVMVPTEMGAGEFIDNGFDRSRITVVPLGVDALPRPDDESIAAAVERHGLVAPYVLFVGTSEPRKGLDVLATALERMGDERPMLALVGPQGWGSDEGGRGVGESLDSLTGQVRRLGFVETSELNLLRAGAAACCLPSRAEGFGLPVLEAMAAGAPVVTTSGTPMAEFSDGVARLVPPGDSDALAEALGELISDPAGASAMRGAGRQRAAEYTWDRAARSVLAVYDGVLGT